MRKILVHEQLAVAQATVRLASGPSGIRQQLVLSSVNHSQMKDKLFSIKNAALTELQCTR